MVGVDFEIETSVLRVWLAVGSASLLVAAGVLVLSQQQTKVPNSVARSGIVIAGAMLAVSVTWIFLHDVGMRDREAERQALEVRAQQLSAVALAPGSALSCLDAMLGESVEAACEKALFATPATVAAADSYVAAQLGLLSDMVAYSEHGGPNVDSTLQVLRRSLEADRYGFLAHVLAVRDGCTSQNCKALAMLHDASHVRANLSDAALEHYLEQYQTAWTKAAEGPVAQAERPDPSATALLVPPGQRKVLVNIDFPTAASIPPISIMNPEPGRDRPGMAAANANQSGTAERRLRKPAANTPAQAAPQSTPPSPDASQAQVDPVWAPTPAAPAPQTAATAAAPAASTAFGPVLLNPFASQH